MPSGSFSSHLKQDAHTVKYGMEYCKKQLELRYAHLDAWCLIKLAQSMRWSRSVI